MERETTKKGGSIVTKLSVSQSPEIEKLGADTKTVMTMLIDLVSGFDISENNFKLLKTKCERLDYPLMLVVVGEYNAGKSSFINHLLEFKKLEVGNAPTTDEVTFVHHVNLPHTFDSRIKCIKSDNTLLDTLIIVDTPGSNAVKGHQAIVEKYIPESDLILFLMSARQTASLSQVLFLTDIKNWIENIKFIITQVDIVHSDELEQASDHLVKELSKIFTPSINKDEIFFISTNVKKDEYHQERNDLDDCINYINNKLSPEYNYSLKIATALSIVSKLSDELYEKIDTQLSDILTSIKKIKQLKVDNKSFMDTRRNVFKNFINKLKGDMEDNKDNVTSLLSNLDKKILKDPGLLDAELKRRYFDSFNKQCGDRIIATFKALSKDCENHMQRIKKVSFDIMNSEDILFETDSIEIYSVIDELKLELGPIALSIAQLHGYKIVAPLSGTTTAVGTYLGLSTGAASGAISTGIANAFPAMTAVAVSTGTALVTGGLSLAVGAGIWAGSGYYKKFKIEKAKKNIFETEYTKWNKNLCRKLEFNYHQPYLESTESNLEKLLDRYMVLCNEKKKVLEPKKENIEHIKVDLGRLLQRSEEYQKKFN